MKGEWEIKLMPDPVQNSKYSQTGLQTSHQTAAFLVERKYTCDTFKSQEHATMYK